MNNLWPLVLTVPFHLSYSQQPSTSTFDVTVVQTWLGIVVACATLVNVAVSVWLGITSHRIQRQQAKMQQQQTAIQRQQAETSAGQFRLALLEKRMAVYDSLMDFLSGIHRGDARVEVNHLFALLRNTREHKFLFGNNVAAFIDEAYNRGLELHTRQARLEAAQRRGEVDSENINRETELLIWFADQLRAAENVFLPYIDFRRP